MARVLVTEEIAARGLAALQERLFAFMERNAIHVSDFFSLPGDQVVEIGRQIAI